MKFACAACGAEQERAVIRCEACGKPLVFATEEKYVLEGHTPVPCGDLIAWALWFEHADRHVKLTLQGDVKVSTVFLGLDHSFGRGPPLLFETMAFVAGEGVVREIFRAPARAEPARE